MESSSDREDEGEEIASMNGSKDEDIQESENDTEKDSQETESRTPETSTTFPLKISVKIARTLMCTGH